MKEFENKDVGITLVGRRIFQFVHIIIETLFSIHAVQRSQKPGSCISSRKLVVLKFATQMHVETCLLIYEGMVNNTQVHCIII